MKKVHEELPTLKIFLVIADLYYFLETYSENDLKIGLNSNSILRSAKSAMQKIHSIARAHVRHGTSFLQRFQ